MINKLVLKREAVQCGDSVDYDSSDKTFKLEIKDGTSRDPKRTDGRR